MESEERYTPIGKVSIIDADTGEKLVDTHNMIVKEGRRLIAKAVFGEGEGNDPAIVKDRFRFFYEQKDSRITTADTGFADVSANLKCRRLKNVLYYQSEDTAAAKFENVVNAAITIAPEPFGSIRIDIADDKAKVELEENGAIIEYARIGDTTSDTLVFEYIDTSDIQSTTTGEYPKYYLKGYYGVNNGETDKTRFHISTFTMPSDIVYTPGDGDEAMKIHLGCAITFDKLNGSTADYDPIYAIGLTYDKDGDNVPDTLFSRAAFDPVYMRKNRTYIVHYTIYF